MLHRRRGRWFLANLAVVIGLGAWAPHTARGAVCGGGTTACGAATTVTYNGVSMALWGSTTNGTVRSEIWYLVAPTSGAHNVVVTAPNATDITATSMSFTGVNQATPLRTMVSAIGTSTTPSTSVTSAVGEPIFDVLGAVGSTTPTVTGNQTVRQTNNTSAGLNPVIVGSSTAAGQSTPVTMSWSITSADWALSAVSIQASSVLTAVGIDAFTATWQPDGALLEWQGGYEPKSAGFFVYRSDGGGEKVLLNATLIPGDAVSGKASSYSFTDSTTGWNGPVSYWLKDVKLDGSFTWVGPASPLAVGVPTPVSSPFPVQGADGGLATDWKVKGATDDGRGGCALADRSRGRAGLQLMLVLGMIVSARRRKHRLIVAALFLAGAVATNLGAPRPAAAAGGVSVDATATGTGASGLTFSHTMGAGSNGLLLVGVVVPINCQDTTTDSGNCGACGTSCAISTVSSLDTGLLGLWHMSEGSGATTADASPNGNTATLSGSPSWVTGYSGNGLQFRGNPTYAEANLGTWFGGNNTLSVAAWVYATSTTNGPIFGVTAANPPGAWNMPFLSIDGSTVYGGLWDGASITSVTGTLSSLDAWHYLTLTYDPASGGTETLYIDGAFTGMASVTYVGSGLTDYWSTYIPGAKPGGVNSYLTGRIDEVRAYDRVLSAAEVTALYTARLGCSASTCAACPMGQTSCGGSCVTTSTDNNNCGGCGVVCNAAGSETCISGVCDCAVGTDCSTYCIVTTSDPNNCGGCAIACGAPTPASVDSGLLGHWHLDEGTGSTSADASGNGNTVGLAGSPTWTTSGYVGDALTFNGTSNYAEAAIGSWFGANNKLTATAWVYATSTTNGPIFGVTMSNPPTNWNMPFLSIAGATVWGGLWDGAAGNYVSATVSLNNWHHLALTYDPSGSGTRKFYVDGVLSNTTTMVYGPSNAFDYWATFIPGDKPTGVNAYFKGTLDEVRAYDRTLSAAEIQLIYYARQSCSSSTCGGCQNGETLCGGICTDKAIDSGNCGACGNACNTAGGETCIASVCGCASGTDCSGVCVDTTTNQNNCGGCGTVCGAATCSSCNMGLLGSWQLDEGTGTTSADSSGNGNTVTFGGTPTWTTGHTGAMGDNALTFSAASLDYINATIGPWFGADNTLSASVWVYATSTTHGPVFGVTALPPGGGWNMPFLSVNGANVYGWIYNNTVMTTTVSLNSWHQLTVTYDPAGSPTSKLYVDGALATTATGSYSNSGVTDTLTTFISGVKPSGVTNSYLNGTIDDLRAYNRVLNAGEISLLYFSQTSCVASTCGGCPAGTTSCSGTCTNLAADNNNCNTCGNVCSGGTPSCVASTCQ